MLNRLLRHIPFILITLSGFVLFALEQRLAGYVLLVAALTFAYFSNKTVAKELLLVAIGLVIVSLVPVNTDISYEHMITMALAMSAAVAVPYLIAKFVYKQSIIQFPFHFREPWVKEKWLYLLFVLVVSYLVLPMYLINTGVYVNWPAATDANSIFRLFIGTNALGIWDELFFICTIFTIYMRHMRFWVANVLQAVVFTSFLYELGFTSIGPFFIYIFALSQGYIFKKTHSLFYLICVHLLIDFILFLVLLHAHNRDFLSIFLY